MLTVLSICCPFTACDLPLGYGLLLVERGGVNLSAVAGSVGGHCGQGLYLFSGGCRVSLSPGQHTVAVLVCFDREFLVRSPASFHWAMQCLQLLKGSLPRKLEGVDLSGARDDLELLKRELGAGRDPRRVQLAFSLLMCALFPLKGDQRAVDGVCPGEFAKLLEQNFRICRSTSFYAGRLGVSPRKLNSWCRGRFAAKGFYGVLIARVMAEAECRLLGSDEPIKVIAFELGFGSVQHFRTYFFRYSGISPSGFRSGQRTVDGDQPAFSGPK